MKLATLSSCFLLPAVLACLPATGATYTSGFTWQRSSDWTPRPISDQGTTRGNPDNDSMGSLVWSYEWVQGGGGLFTANPWYTQPSQRLIWDAEWYVTGVPGWARADDVGNGVSQDYTPFVSQTAMTQNLSPVLPISSPDQEPLVRWSNPASYTLDLSISGMLRVEWTGEGTGYPVNVDLVLAQESAEGGFGILFARTVSKPHDDTTPESLDVPLNTSAVVDAGDSLLLSLRADGESLHNWVILADPLTITIIPEPSRFALLAVGLGTLFGVRRWRRRPLIQNTSQSF